MGAATLAAWRLHGDKGLCMAGAWRRMAAHGAVQQIRACSHFARRRARRARSPPRCGVCEQVQGGGPAGGRHRRFHGAGAAQKAAVGSVLVVHAGGACGPGGRPALAEAPRLTAPPAPPPRLPPQLFEVGVDEMSWDDLSQAKEDWPAVREAWAYRGKAYKVRARRARDGICGVWAARERACRAAHRRRGGSRRRSGSADAARRPPLQQWTRNPLLRRLP